MMYKRVAILGIDGAGNFVAQADTPNLDELLENGTVTYDALTALPSVSAQCWGSMLVGVDPDLHGLTNDIAATVPYDVNSPYPSIFRVARAALPQAALAAFSNWNPINLGIIEETHGVQKDTADSDAALCGKILAYLDANDPTLLFVQFDEVDGVGHRSGYGPDVKPYLEKISEVDALIGKVVAKYREKGYADDTLFIVSSDHGGIERPDAETRGIHRYGHGGDSDAEKRIFIGCAGKDVKKGRIVNMRVRDIPAVAAKALGLDAPAAWTGTVPEGIFAG